MNKSSIKFNCISGNSLSKDINGNLKVSEELYDKEDLKKYELKRILKEKYNIEIEKIEKNEESTDGNVYMVYCKDKKYVIKIYNSIEHTKSMIKLHNKLTKLKLNIPYVIFDKQKKGYEKILNKNYFVVYSFLNGE